MEDIQKIVDEEEEYNIQDAVQKMIEKEKKTELQSLHRRLSIVPKKLKQYRLKKKKKNKISKKARRKNR
jgi:hypothetical protein